MSRNQIQVAYLYCISLATDQKEQKKKNICNIWTLLLALSTKNLI